MKKEDVKVDSKEVDKVLVEQKEAQFDAINSAIANKGYDLNLDYDAATGLLNFFDTAQWKGYECYGVEKLYDTLVPDLVEVGEEGENMFTLETIVQAEIIEAMFYFIKSYVATGIENAKLFRKLSDSFAIPMQNINIDRQALRDAALELTAAQQGLTVAQLEESADEANA